MDKTQRNGSCKELWLVIPFLLLIFSLTTPYNPNWPSDVEYKKNIIQVNEAISRMERGNMGRRVGLVLLGIYGLVLLSVTRNRFRINSPMGWVLVFYLCWVVLSLLWSIDKLFTIRRAATFLILWAAAIATASRYSIKDIALIAFYVCGITAGLAFANEIRLHTFEPFNESWRFSGLFHTVMMGWNCGMFTLSAYYLASVSSCNWKKIFFFLMTLAALCLLLLTKSRMAVASTLAALCLFWFMVSSARTRVGAFLLVVMMLCTGYLCLGEKIFEYGEAATTLGRGESARESIGTLTGRLPLWQECFRWAAKRPILGYGFNTFISPKHYVEISQNVGWTPSSIHSGYIDALMGLGFIGLASMVGLFSTALLRAFSLARNSVPYVFTVAVLIWLCYNLFLEANLFIRPTFMTFVVLVLLSHLAVLPADGSKSYC